MSSPARKLIGVCIAAIVTSACQKTLTGRAAPDDEIYYPLGVQPSPDDGAGNSGEILYVISTNWDQRYNTGWLSVVDLAGIVNGTVTTPAEAQIQRVLVPSLGSELTMAPDVDPNTGHHYLVIPFRQNNQIGIFEILDDGTIYCGDPNATAGLNFKDRQTDCDGRHLYDFVQKGPDVNTVPDQYRAPYGLRFMPKLQPTDPDTMVIGFLQAYLGKCLISFLDVDFASDHEILVNQRSIDMRQGVSGLSVLSTGIVAGYPIADSTTGGGQYAAIASRLSQNNATSATIFNLDLSTYDFNAPLTTNDGADDAENLAQIERVDIRTQSGGFNVADLRFSRDGTRAFAAVSFPQPITGAADSIIMMDTTPRSDQILLPQGDAIVVQRPDYTVLDSLAIQGTPQTVLYMEDRDEGRPDLIVTATFNDNAVHFVRVGPTSLDAITRVDRSAGGGPVTTAQAHFVPQSELAAGTTRRHDYVIVNAFLTHTISVFDVTEQDPALWLQYSITSDLPQGERFH